jgi:hypothetical protein
MAIFFFDQMACRTNHDEIRWACYLWSNRKWPYLQTLKRRDLIVLFNLSKGGVPLSSVRSEVTLHPTSGGPIELVLDEVDLGDRKLEMLLALCERENKARFLQSDAAMLARGEYHAVGSLMLKIRDPGGAASEDHVPMQVSGVGSEAQEPQVIAARGDESETESAKSESLLTSTASRKARAKLLREDTLEKRKRVEANLARLADEDSSFEEKAVIIKNEIGLDNAAEEKRRLADLDKVKPTDRNDRGNKDDQLMMAAATADLIGDRLRKLVLWNKISLDYVNVQTEWCVVNAPNSDSLILVQPTLVDARVIDVEQFRSFVDVAMEEVRIFDRGPKNAAKPPH